MRDALPHLFAHSPDLLYQLVTLVSPAQLKVSTPQHSSCSCLSSDVEGLEDMRVHSGGSGACM